ncbi:hypothetical protein CYLTODRAFT_494956 [Cylindrobasidium torrendii FP15055 ss-10]|uniref:CxC2-like cysteine cluster KDZ transposase-associated domain-containing protein n=1 Tax=Cylindrobasidium torrendii FP15055 ss-10 TaxID=1314674 RepID=A0A0D7AUB3_9AGAR|nr:hypothetical protein CYLTODRAFT_494956 [Cylindrobasidium torrendii FP15055 ss-10]
MPSVVEDFRAPLTNKRTHINSAFRGPLDSLPTDAVSAHHLEIDEEDCVYSQPIAPKRLRLDNGDFNDEFNSWVYNRPETLGDVNGEISDLPAPSNADEATTYVGHGAYENSIDPMKTWRTHQATFLQERMRFHGLGNAIHNPRCSVPKCNTRYVSNAEHPLPDGTTDTLFRCRTCGNFLVCGSCCLERHRHNPTHIIEEWTGRSFRRTSLIHIGLVYQVGHGGYPCVKPRSPQQRRTMTVIDTSGIHHVAVDFCACEDGQTISDWQQLFRDGLYPATTQAPQTCATFAVLDMYRMLLVSSALSVHKFIQALSGITDPWGVDNVVDREKELARTTRQWAFLSRVLRAGSIFDANGWEPGLVVQQCWACPYPSVNIPDDWRERNNQWLYRPIMSIDANFKMKLRDRIHKNHIDPPLYNGLGIQPPIDMFEHWISTNVPELSKSDCAVFAALLQKETRSEVGLKWTGLVGTFCARHELVHATTNLEKGEKYRNVDFCLAWAMSRMKPQTLAITYDIACQYKKNFHKRFEALPSVIKDLDLPPADMLMFALPYWHGNVHDVLCEMRNSVKTKRGIGRTDGETPEREWSDINHFAGITREQSEGARYDLLEDVYDHINHRKLVGIGNTLFRRIKIAACELAVQEDSFAHINASISPALARTWEQHILDFEANPDTAMNPYVVAGEETLTEQEVRRDLKREEDRERASDLGEDSDGHDSGTVTHTQFVIMGIELEEAQRRLRNDKVRIGADPTAAEEGRILDRRLALRARLKSFMKYQRQYLENFDQLLSADEDERRALGSGPPDPEDTIIYMPWNSPGHASETLCSIERPLRAAQCTDVLKLLRNRLLAHRSFLNVRNKFISGQVARTRAQTLIDSLQTKIVELSLKYRECFESYVSLVGSEEECLPLRRLEKEDVSVFHVDESDSEAIKNLNRLDGRDPRATSSRRKANARRPGHAPRRDEPGLSTSTMKWIWVGGGVPEVGDDGLMHRSILCEWSKAKARRDRWWEEMELLKEEMRRVVESLKHEEHVWQQRAIGAGREDETADVASGRVSFCLAQAEGRRRVRESFLSLWLRTEPPRGKVWDKWDTKRLEAINEALSTNVTATNIGAVAKHDFDASGTFPEKLPHQVFLLDLMILPYHRRHFLLVLVLIAPRRDGVVSFLGGPFGDAEDPSMARTSSLQAVRFVF